MSEHPIVVDSSTAAAPAFEQLSRTPTPTARALAVSVHTTMQSHHLSTDVQQRTIEPRAATEVDA